MKKVLSFFVIFSILTGFIFIPSWQSTASTLGSWTTAVSTMPTGRYKLEVAEVNARLYAIGGYSNGSYLNTVEEYEPLLDTWTTKANMPTARDSVELAVVNERIYAFGGYNSNDYLTTVEEYYPATNTWTRKADMPRQRSGFGAAVVGNKIYLVGGRTYETDQLPVDVYDPATNTWSTTANTSVQRYKAGVEAVNGKIYVMGGIDIKFNALFNIVNEYNPVTDTWTSKASMLTARAYMATAVFNNRIYAMGGSTGTTVEVYEPATNTWATEASMPRGRSSFGAGTIYSHIYAIGGGNGLEPYTTAVDILSPSVPPSPTPAPTPTPYTSAALDALKYTCTSSAQTMSSKYWYWKISTDAYTFKSGDYIEYDVCIENDNAGLGGIEIYNTDGTWFRDQAGWKDQNGISGHPNRDISDYAYKKWYHRKLTVPAAMVGKTSADFDLAVEYNSNSQTYVSYYDNIAVTNNGTVVKEIYINGMPSYNASRGGLGYACDAYFSGAQGAGKLFVNEFETTDEPLTWTDSIETSRNVSGYLAGLNPECGKDAGVLRFSGKDDSTSSSYCYFKIFDVNIPVSSMTVLKYSFNPENENTRHIAIDLVCTDGTTLRDSGAVDYNGISMHPGAGHGVISLNTDTFCNIGKWLNGKTIDRILVGYDHNADTGQFRGFIDSLWITNGTWQ